MPAIVEFRIPVDQFALAHTVAEVSELHVEIGRFVAQNTDSVMPFVWITTDDFDAFETAVAADPSVEQFSMLAEIDGERLYRMHWVVDVKHVLYLLLEKNGVITAATMSTNSQSWEVQVMCPERDSLSDIYEFCEENGLSLTVDAAYELSNHDRTRHGLTESQHTTLLQAKEEGYYDIPRQIGVTELADELDISHQAVSERLRRGHYNLIDRSLSSTDRIRTDSEADSPPS